MLVPLLRTPGSEEQLEASHLLLAGPREGPGRGQCSSRNSLMKNSWPPCWSAKDQTHLALLRRSAWAP